MSDIGIDLLSHDTRTPIGRTVECFLCGRAVGVQMNELPAPGAFRVEHEFGFPLYCHSDCINGIAVERLIVRYHKSVDRVMHDTVLGPK